MPYTHTCGYDGGKGWVIARTTRDWALATFANSENWEDVGEVAPEFPDNPYASGGDVELNPEYHLSCPQCGEDVEEAEIVDAFKPHTEGDAHACPSSP